MLCFALMPSMGDWVGWRFGEYFVVCYSKDSRFLRFRNISKKTFLLYSCQYWMRVLPTAPVGMLSSHRLHRRRRLVDWAIIQARLWGFLYGKFCPTWGCNAGVSRQWGQCFSDTVVIQHNRLISKRPCIWQY